jgi:cytochrome c-type biogenesis protein CcmH
LQLLKKVISNMVLNKFGLSTFLSFFLALFAIGVSFAQDTQPTPLPVTDNQVNAIAKQLYCPVCENTPLDVCPTQACAEWRELIREQLSQGWNEQQIKAYFVERFGDRVLATPPPRGLNWLVYVIPPLAFGAGAFLLYRAFISWRSSTTLEMDLPEKKIESANDPYVEQLEEELRKL